MTGIRTVDPLDEAPRLPPAPTAALAAVALSLWCAHAQLVSEDPRRTFSALLLSTSVAILLPVLMAAGILGMTLVAALLLGPLQALAMAQGRPSGIRLVLRDLARPGIAFVPGYYRAWRRAASPLAFGALLGSVAAIPVVAVSC